MATAIPVPSQLRRRIQYYSFQGLGDFVSWAACLDYLAVGASVWRFAAVLRAVRQLSPSGLARLGMITESTTTDRDLKDASVCHGAWCATDNVCTPV
jgi:hypothetical protein